MKSTKKAVKVRRVLRVKKPMHLSKKIKVHDSESPVQVSAERAFWVHDGGAVKDLKELHEALEAMSPEQFEYHTLRNGNDFARWIRDVLLDPECADKVEGAKNQKETVKVISKFI